jgi:hypothetical protein
MINTPRIYSQKDTFLLKVCLRVMFMMEELKSFVWNFTVNGRCSSFIGFFTVSFYCCKRNK